MDTMSFGEVLRQTRERKGLDLNATARRLRIRPDILKAIEDSNFAAMPPRGYARNMVNGYARYLGLNPTEITGMYLDELYAYQQDFANARKRPTGIEMPDSDGSLSARRASTARSTRSGGASVRSSQGQSPRSGRVQVSPSSGQNRKESYTNFFAGPAADTGWRSKLPYIIAALIILLILGLVAHALLNRGGSPAEESVPNVPITGVSSSSSSSSSSESSTPVVTEQAPVKFTFQIDVEDGVQSWIEVYIDGTNELADVLTGPQSESYDCSGTLQFVCANPQGVTAKLDGKAVEFEIDDSGIVNMTFDFNDILTQWRADRGLSTTAVQNSSDDTSTGTAQ